MQENNKEEIYSAPKGWGKKITLGYRKMVFPTVMVGAIACAIGMGSIVNKNTDTVYAIEYKEVQSELSRQVKEVKKSKDSFDKKTKKLAEEKKAKEAAEQKAKEEQEKKEAEEKARQEEESKQAQAQAQAEAEAKAKAEAEAAAQAQQTQAQAPVATQSWNGSVLTPSAGINYGPSGKETYYNLDMSGVISIMRGIGNNDEYWVRSDGVKMLGDYVMVAANLNVHPRGSLVETSLGTGIVCDTGSFAYGNATQLDIATSW